MGICRRDFDKTKCMYFLKKDEFFFLVNLIWEKVNHIIKKEFNSKLVHALKNI